MNAWLKPCLAALIVAAAASSQAAQCLGRTSLGAAKQFLGAHYNFYKETPDRVKDFVSPLLYSLLKQEEACRAKGDICAGSIDPWLGTQDGEMGDRVRFTLKETAVAHSVVVLRYDYFASPSARPSEQAVELHLQRRPSDECWIILDLISPGGYSLVEGLSQWHAGHAERPAVKTNNESPLELLNR